MIDFTEIAYDSDGWAQFARDFFSARGFYIESTIDRGPDGGKDLLLVEHLAGRLGNYQMRWLASFKHFATSGKSVSEKDEPNILERLKDFKADGFIGFYSTIASSGLNSRLKGLRDNQAIKDYSIFDGRLIESELVNVGYSPMMMRYFPKSYERIRPLHLLTDEYIPLKCKVCDKDLLAASFTKADCGLIVLAYEEVNDFARHHYNVYAVCKGSCDDVAQEENRRLYLSDSSYELQSVMRPVHFLRTVFGAMSRAKRGVETYNDDAFEEAINIMAAIAQRVLRSSTMEDFEHSSLLAALSSQQ